MQQNDRSTVSHEMLHLQRKLYTQEQIEYTRALMSVAYTEYCVQEVARARHYREQGIDYPLPPPLETSAPAPSMQTSMTGELTSVPPAALEIAAPAGTHSHQLYRPSSDLERAQIASLSAEMSRASEPFTSYYREQGHKHVSTGAYPTKSALSRRSQ